MVTPMQLEKAMTVFKKAMKDEDYHKMWRSILTTSFEFAAMRARLTDDCILLHEVSVNAADDFLSVFLTSKED